ncbi:MAG: carboxypeptidase-like regulatory domain-containing protein [Deltaproteobacteria bacterium]|nr:carboxypeptidase-like regulatory domain-containing protein [Deltaproteobacteria bacterium]
MKIKMLGACLLILAAVSFPVPADAQCEQITTWSENDTSFFNFPAESIEVRVISNEPAYDATVDDWMTEFEIMIYVNDVPWGVEVNIHSYTSEATAIRALDIRDLRDITIISEEDGEVAWVTGEYDPQENVVGNFHLRAAYRGSLISLDGSAPFGGRRQRLNRVIQLYQDVRDQAKTLIDSKCVLSDGTGSIAGVVLDATTGAPLAGAMVSISQQQSTTTDISGSFSFADIAPGVYTLTASAPNYDQDSREVTVTADQTSNLTISLLPRVPQVTATVDPNSASAGRIVTLRARVSDPDGAQDIVSVSADLSPIGLSRNTEMLESNGSWRVTFTVPAGVRLGLAVLRVAARDSGGAVGYGDVSLEIQAEFRGIVTDDRPVVQTFENRVSGQTLIFEFGSLPGVRILRQACVTQLTVMSPDGSTYGPYTITAGGQATIENAAAGTWTAEVQTTCTEAVEYSFRARGSGTGVVAGVVKNRRGRMLSNVRVTSSSGGAALAVNGYFLMVVPAGNHTLTADAAFISQGSSAATVVAGSTATVTMEVEQTLPAIWLKLDRSSYGTGETPMIRASLYTGTSQNTVDAFVVLQAPDGRYYQYGSWNEATGPTVPSFEVIDVEDASVPGHSITEETARGTWTYYGAFTSPGTWELVGDICSAPFQVVP